jgi:hypothetical protein
VLTKNKSEHNHFFLTYDTVGYDWTIRVWDISRGDQLVASFTCPSRILSLDVNVAPFYFDENSQHTKAHNDEFYITASVYGSTQLLLLKLMPNSKKQHKETAYTDSFSTDATLNGVSNKLTV